RRPTEKQGSEGHQSNRPAKSPGNSTHFSDVLLPAPGAGKAGRAGRGEENPSRENGRGGHPATHPVGCAGTQPDAGGEGYWRSPGRGAFPLAGCQESAHFSREAPRSHHRGRSTVRLHVGPDHSERLGEKTTPGDRGVPQEKGYKQKPHPAAKLLTEMEPGTFTFRM